MESLDSSESQRGHFEFSWVGVTRILRITASDLAPWIPLLRAMSHSLGQDISLNNARRLDCWDTLDQT